MNILREAYCQDYEQTKSGNFQGIKEALLRLAVKYCENYATDVIILLDYINGMNKNTNVYSYTIDIGFRQFGIDWPLNTETRYRYLVKFNRKGNNFTLSGEYGSV